MRRLIFLLLLLPIFSFAQTRQSGGISFTPQYNYKISGSDTTWQFGNTLMSPQQFPFILTKWQSDQRYAPIAGGGYVPTTRLVSTTTPLQGGGNLGSNLSLSILQASTSQSGYLSATDWNTFNGKAPSSGSANYIQASPGSTQSAGFDINGQAVFRNATTLFYDPVTGNRLVVNGKSINSQKYPSFTTNDTLKFQTSGGRVAMNATLNVDSLIRVGVSTKIGKWPNVYGLPQNTVYDDNLIRNTDGNVATIQNLNHNAFSAIRYADEFGYERMAFGYGNTGTGAGVFAGNSYWESLKLTNSLLSPVFLPKIIVGTIADTISRTGINKIQQAFQNDGSIVLYDQTALSDLQAVVLSGNTVTLGGNSSATTILRGLTTNGIVTTSGGTGTLGVTIPSAFNAGTATKLQTARAINGVSFDGTAPITITSNTTNALTIGSDLSGSSFNGGSAVTINNTSTLSTVAGRGNTTNNGIIFGTYDALQATNGSITKHSVVGLTMRGIAGSAFDWSVYNPAGNAIMFNSTGTNDITVNYGLRVNGSVNPASTQTTVNGSTSGSIVASMPFQGSSYKKVLIYVNALFGTATYTFPTAFTNTPFLSGSSIAVSPSVNTTSISFSSAGAQTGWMILEGY